MADMLSPGISVNEIDLTTIVPAVSTTVGALAGLFRWGPVDERVLIDNETNLVKRFGKPTNFNAETWFTAANFLSYSNALVISRAANTSTSNASQSALNAVATANNGSVSNIALQVVKNSSDYALKDGNFDTDVCYIAKYPGALGNSLRISQCDSPEAFKNTLSFTGTVANTTNSAIIYNITGNLSIEVGSKQASIVLAPVSNTDPMVAANQYGTSIADSIAVGDYISVGNTSIGIQYLKVTSVSNVVSNSTVTSLNVNFQDPYRLSTNYTTTSTLRFWEFHNSVEQSPGQSSYQASFGNNDVNDELHVVVIDDRGLFTGTPGTILEVFQGLSRATNSKTLDGVGNYYKDVINNGSSYVWFANDRENAVSNTATDLLDSTNDKAFNVNFTLGADGPDETNVPVATIATGYDLFNSVEDVDISIIMQGKPLGGTGTVNGKTYNGFQIGNYILDNIVNIRKDCVACISPNKSVITENKGNEAFAISDYRTLLRDTSYGIMDSGYKYQYDRYNDVYRYVPLNGDIAGLIARTDFTNDSWWSPAGFNRGQIKNIVKLLYNPKQADRDQLYKNGINPVVTLTGQGTVLYGDKTMQIKPSAFDRINVRRLFITLEKAISVASRYSLFEFNDEFTRSQFKNLVTPYLREVKGRRGITDFLVVCDTTNNTGQVIDSNQFVGDIYIKPSRSINYIKLNFINVGTDTQFSTIIGAF